MMRSGAFETARSGARAACETQLRFGVSSKGPPERRQKQPISLKGASQRPPPGHVRGSGEDGGL
eukprot:6277917-Lingulodinium_polyedra.AAC.1